MSGSLSTCTAVSLTGNDHVSCVVDELNEMLELTIGDADRTVILSMSRDIFTQIVHHGVNLLPRFERHVAD